MCAPVVPLCVSEHMSMCVWACEPNKLHGALSPLSDLFTLKVMMGNFSSRRKSLLRRTHNFLPKKRIIFPLSSVSLEKGVVMTEDRREGGTAASSKKDL